jgi:hypothetical protein
LNSKRSGFDGRFLDIRGISSLDLLEKSDIVREEALELRL